jgi:hypothetical protein
VISKKDLFALVKAFRKGDPSAKSALAELASTQSGRRLISSAFKENDDARLLRIARAKSEKTVFKSPRRPFQGGATGLKK